MKYWDFKERIKKISKHFRDKVFLIQHKSEYQLSYQGFYNKIISPVFPKGAIIEGDIVFLQLDNNINSIVVLFHLFVNGVKPILIKKNIPDSEIRKLSEALNCTKIISFFEEPLIEYLSVEIKNDILPLKEEVAYLVFTSGSSGMPKGIQISYDNILAETMMMIDAYSMKQSDRHLCVLPIFHASGLYRNVIMAYFSGATSVLVSNFKFVDFWNLIENYQISFTQITPTIINSLTNEPWSSFSKPESIRFIGSASAPHPKKLVFDFEDKFEVPLLVGYGMTEATCGITLNADLPRKNYSVGRALPGIQLELYDDEKIVPTGDEGQVVISGPNLMLGYLSFEESDKIKFQDNKLFTGDLGYMDEDGYLYLIGRKNDIVKRGAYRVNIGSIEKILNELKLIKESAVVDIPHRFLGTDIVAFVELNSTEKIGSNEILKLSKPYLDTSMVPSEFIVIDEIPKIDNLKIDRKSLKEKYFELRNGR